MYYSIEYMGTSCKAIFLKRDFLLCQFCIIENAVVCTEGTYRQFTGHSSRQFWEPVTSPNLLVIDIRCLSFCQILIMPLFVGKTFLQNLMAAFKVQFINSFMFNSVADFHDFSLRYVKCHCMSQPISTFLLYNDRTIYLFDQFKYCKSSNKSPGFYQNKLLFPLACIGDPSYV